MLELKFVLQNIDFVIERLQTRKINVDFIRNLVPLNTTRKNLISEIEKLRFKKNIISRNFSDFKNESFTAELRQKEKDSKKKIKELDEKLHIVSNKINDILYQIPNLPHESILKIQKNKEVYRYLDLPKFNFKIKNHIELGKELDILDFPKAAKITSSRFVVLKDMGATLERSLINFMIDLNKTKGYREILPPFIVNEKSMFSTGQLPKFKEELFSFLSDKQKFFLNPTAEVPIINFHRDEVLSFEQLPLKYVGYTTCFRQESAASGINTRGLFRQKQFNKVELIQFVEPQNSYIFLKKMLEDSEDILKKLKLPYRVLQLSADELGFGMSKTYDIEVWLPGQNKYREIASISNSETFQSKRANIKFVKNSEKGYVHILNGSALAVGRTMIAIMENYQNSDGSITIPEVLRSYIKKDIIKKNNLSKI
ncbi:serine--tRNA ligase [Texas Phoenix palm phytoplasma]|uniref:Serine--tRNA ligase n=1 Tax=Texas Phoenix palm phytoplasma TaxID=176709 RepID=A0ABS5BI06_9MOLU|nr:serine--tRNA ligase [Texas Phoenix palm phytoplasma]MBP3059215.1 serine--tRNA ligase [Texas Phoenix palm phytoplasma]